MTPERLTLSGARALPGPVVYALSDAKGTFYIGRTKNPARRFYQHQSLTGENIYLIKRLRESGSSVQVEVLSSDPKSLVAAELDAIRLHSATLLNFAGNPGRLPSAGSGVVNVVCPQCGGGLDHPRQKLCKSCTTKLLNRGGSSKQELRALAASAVASFKTR